MGHEALKPEHEAQNVQAQYPSVWILVLVWSFIGAATSLRNFLAFPHSMRTDFIFWVAYIACYMPWGVLTAITLRLERRFPLGTAHGPRHVTALVLASIPVSLIAAPLMRGAFEGTLYLLGHPVTRTHTWSHWFYELFIGEFFFWLSVVGGYSLRTLFQLQRQRNEAMQLSLEKSQLEASLNQAQLDVLRAKLNPHFLFNSLQNISVLTRQNPLLASRMLVKLGDLLRAVLRSDSLAYSSLREEITLLQHYMALELMRFGDRLHFDVQVGQDAEQVMVPTFILQPLVENAIVHGLRDIQENGIIRIRGSLHGDKLVVVIMDNGVGISRAKHSEGSGMGLRSTRERLERMYPGLQSFSINSSPGRGTRIRIEIPSMSSGTAEAEEEHAASNR